MAVTKDQIKQEYPLPVYNYKVEIDGETISFTEVSGLTIQYDVTIYKESPTSNSAVGPRVLHMPAQGTPTNLSMKKGVMRGVSVPTLYNWISTIAINQVVKKDIIVRLCDETGSAVISWKVINAFPTKLDAPTFDANSNDVAVESMDLRADGITIEES
jgi:phage tail-like protein